MFEFYFDVLSIIFAPLLDVPVLGVLILSAGISIVISFIYKFFVDQNKIKEIREELKNIQKEIKEAQKTNTEKANQLSNEMFKLTNKQMMLNMKPMIFSMFLIFPLLPWIASVFTGPVALLPFNMPFFGNNFGWLMWYIIVSITFSMFSRKLLGVI